MKLNEIGNNISRQEQLDIINKSLGDISVGIIPSEDIQIFMVTRNAYSIKTLINAGVIPSEAVQLAAVNNNGYVIGEIIAAGIKPSDDVQLVAVQNYGLAFEHIRKAGINPSDAVKQALLSNDRLIQHTDDYNDYVYMLYPNNELMQKKWIRYGNRMRDT